MQKPPHLPSSSPDPENVRPGPYPGDVTRYFAGAARGDRVARDWILSELMAELLVTARACIRRGGFVGKSAGEVISDTYLRLRGGAFRACGDRSEFLRYAGRAMHFLLLDEARRAERDRARPMGSVSFTAGPTEQAQDVLVLEFIESLRETKPLHATYCELRYMAGLSHKKVVESYSEFSVRKARDVRNDLKAMLGRGDVQRS